MYTYQVENNWNLVLFQDVWAGHGSVLTINSSGQFVGVSLNSGRAGVKPPLDAINLTQSVDKVRQLIIYLSRVFDHMISTKTFL